MGLNKMLVIGNVGTDPDMRYTPNGNPVTSFRLATSRSYTTSGGERREETEWFRVVCWNQLAERCNQFVTKGKRVYVEGRLKSDTWTGNDGQARFTNEIIASQVLFLDRSPQADGERAERDFGGPQADAERTEREPGAVRDASDSDAEDLPW